MDPPDYIGSVLQYYYQCYDDTRYYESGFEYQWTGTGTTLPVIEPMDMRFVMNTTITTMPSAENPSAGLIPTAAPNIVATPLPPLNLSDHRPYVTYENSQRAYISCQIASDEASQKRRCHALEHVHEKSYCSRFLAQHTQGIGRTRRCRFPLSLYRSPWPSPSVSTARDYPGNTQPEPVQPAERYTGLQS